MVQGSLDVRDAHIRLNDAVQAPRPISGSTAWGPVTLYPDRTEIDAAEIQGRIQQKSSLPLIVNGSKIIAGQAGNGAYYAVDTQGRVANAITELHDCTIWGGRTRAAAFGGSVTFERCDISGGEDLIDMHSATHLRNCYLHDLERREGSHNDVIQCGGAVGASVVHCTLLAAKRMPDGQGVEFPDGWYDPMNAVLMIGDYGGRINDVLIEDCLVDGGNYTFNDNWRGNHPVDNVVVRGNRFGRHFKFGPKSLDGPAWLWEDNVWDDSGETV